MLPEIEFGAFSALVQVILIDLVLAGDNAVAVALAAAGLPAHQRRKVIVTGIALAAVLRVLFALVTVQLLKVPGLLLVGGLLLLWIAWKLALELRHHGPAPGDQPAERMRKHAPGKTVRQAMLQILIADFSMSLDNVLGVAAVAREHPVVLVIGLVLSVAFMGFAASLIGRLLERHRWIAWVGVAIIFWVGIVMVLEGGPEILELVRA
ncbi:MAG: YjbE family putative metal transport protein [Immundisolibacterales bacterium]|nr:YjbE family putative metal transport protein [Immundisolibacterales bacterium]